MNDDIFTNLKRKDSDTQKGDKKGDIFKGLKKKEDNNLPELSNMYLPNHIVAIPHCFSQTSIYAPRLNKNRDVVLKKENIWSQGDLNIIYKGPELDTMIDSRLMSLVLKARDLQKSKNNVVKLKFKETMLALNLNPHHPNSRKKFISSIDRHLGAKIYFCKGEDDIGFWKTFFVAEKTIHSYRDNILQIQLSDFIPMMFKLKKSGSFSIEDMFISFATKSSYANKLYSYYESNQNPYPVKVSTLLEICDKKIADNKKPTNNHRKVIKEALDELKLLNFLEDWYYDTSKDKRDPLVVIVKKAKECRVCNKDESKTFSSDYMLTVDYN